MKKLIKLFVASTIALGTVAGVSVSTVAPVSDTVHAASSPYYTYQGYINGDASFLINKQFINAVKSDNVTFNGIKLAYTTGTKTVNKYDQTFKGVTKNGHRANKLQFIVKKDLTLNQLKQAYGKDLMKKNNSDKKDCGIFYYRPSSNGLGVWFVVDQNRVVEVSIGHVPFTTSK